jgi:two-component system cell cycle response regulator
MASKILVADDEREVRNLISTFLTDEGYQVIAAENGEKAIDLAAAENPDVILLDHRMPGIDGIEVCKQLKATEATRLIPIIMVTGFTDNKMEAVHSGAEDFVNKPFDMVELSIRVKSILRMRYLSDELDRTLAYVDELQKSLPKL